MVKEGRAIEITLKAARVNAGLTREQVYQKTGIAQKTLYSWEKGLTFPKVNRLNQLCELYGVPIEYIKK